MIIRIFEVSRTAIKLNGIKRANELYLSPVMAELKRRFIASLEDETPIEIQIKVFRNPKSQKQLGAIFGLMLKQACLEMEDLGLDTSYLFKLDKPTGIKIDTDLLKEYAYSVCPIFDENGEKITLRDSNTEQAAKFFEDFRAFLASQFGIVIPDPDPMYKELKNERAGTQKDRKKTQ